MLLIVLIVIIFMDSSCAVFSFVPNDNLPDIQKRIPIESVGWLGADVATSIKIGEEEEQGVYLWLWGDTLVGKSFSKNNTLFRDFTTMPRNTLGILNMNDTSNMVHYLATEGSNQTGGFFNSTRRGEWLWPMTGFTNGRTLYILAGAFANTGKKGPFSFAQTQNTLISVDLSVSGLNPSLWKPRITDLPFFNANLSWSVGAAVSDGYAYLMGTLKREKRIAGVLMRIPTDKLPVFEENAEFLVEGGSWSSRFDISKLSDVFPEIPPETSLQWHQRLGWFYLSIPFLASSVNIHYSKNIIGPYQSQLLFKLPSEYTGPKFFCYAPKVHPELSSSKDDFVFSFMSNSFNIEDLEDHPWIYIPKFVQIKIVD